MLKIAAKTVGVSKGGTDAKKRTGMWPEFRKKWGGAYSRVSAVVKL